MALILVHLETKTNCCNFGKRKNNPIQTCPVDQLVYLTEPSTWVFSFKCSLAHFKAKKVKFSPILPELLTGSNC